MKNALEQAECLAGLLAGTDLASLELRGPEGSLRLVRRGAVFVAEDIPPEPAGFQGLIVHADGPGVFLHRHPLRSEPEVVAGEWVGAGAILGFLRVGPLMRAVRAPVAGFLADILLEEGAVAGFGAPLFEIDPGTREGAA